MDFQGIIGLLATAGCCFGHFDPFRLASFYLWEQYPMSTSNSSFVWGNLPVLLSTSDLLVLSINNGSDGPGPAGGGGSGSSNGSSGDDGGGSSSSTGALPPPAKDGPLYSVGRQAASMMDTQEAYDAVDAAMEKFMEAAVRAYVHSSV